MLRVGAQPILREGSAHNWRPLGHGVFAELFKVVATLVNALGRQAVIQKEGVPPHVNLHSAATATLDSTGGCEGDCLLEACVPDIAPGATDVRDHIYDEALRPHIGALVVI